MIEKIKVLEFLGNAEEEFIKIDMAPLSELEELLTELGFEKGEFDCNGWQYDFWLYMKSGTFGDVCISGSAYYGNYTIMKEEK